MTRKFLAEHGEIVIKPLHGFAGGSVFRIGSDGRNLASLMELFNRTYREPHVVQKFLPGDRQGRQAHHSRRRRNCWRRQPRSGRGRNPVQSRGRRHAAKTELTKREEEICAVLGPELKRLGLLFVGIDVIGGRWLTEINVTSPTGIVAVDKFNGTDTPALIFDAIGRRLKK